MSDMQKRKWLFYLLIGLILLTFLPFTPQKRNPSLYDAQWGGYRNLYLSNAVRPASPEDGLDGGTVSEKFVRPAAEIALDCKLPEDMDSITLGRTGIHDTAERERYQGRYQAFRFLTIVFAMVLFPCIVFRIALRRFASRTIALWQNIVYIHRTDGKKEHTLLYE